VLVRIRIVGTQPRRYYRSADTSFASDVFRPDPDLHAALTLFSLYHSCNILPAWMKIKEYGALRR